MCWDGPRAPWDEGDCTVYGSCDVHACGPRAQSLAVFGRHEGAGESTVPECSRVADRHLWRRCWELCPAVFRQHKSRLRRPNMSSAGGNLLLPPRFPSATPAPMQQQQQPSTRQDTQPVQGGWVENILFGFVFVLLLARQPAIPKTSVKEWFPQSLGLKRRRLVDRASQKHFPPRLSPAVSSGLSSILSLMEFWFLVAVASGLLSWGHFHFQWYHRLNCTDAI